MSLGVAAGLVVALAACSGINDPEAASSTSVADVSDERDVFAAHMKSCLAESGFAAEVTPDGGIQMRYPNDQEEAAAAAQQACLGSSPEYDPSLPLPSEAELAALFSSLLETKACLEAQGFEVSDPPTADAFAENPGMWHPYLSIPEDLPIEAWHELNAKCPQP